MGEIYASQKLSSHAARKTILQALPEPEASAGVIAITPSIQQTLHRL